MNTYNCKVNHLICKLGRILVLNKIEVRYPSLGIEMTIGIKCVDGNKYAPLPIFIYDDCTIIKKLENWLLVYTKDRYGRICVNPWLKLSKDSEGDSIYYIENAIEEIINLIKAFKDNMNHKYYLQMKNINI